MKKVRDDNGVDPTTIIIQNFMTENSFGDVILKVLLSVHGKLVIQIEIQLKSGKSLQFPESQLRNTLV